jgi:hypothetical protein
MWAVTCEVRKYKFSDARSPSSPSLNAFLLHKAGRRIFVSLTDLNLRLQFSCRTNLTALFRRDSRCWYPWNTILRFFTIPWIFLKIFLEFENSIFLNITSGSRFKINQRFRRTYPFHFQGRRESQARKQHEAGNLYYYILIRIGHLFLIILNELSTTRTETCQGWRNSSTYSWSRL